MSLLEKASLIVTPNAYKESILYSVVPNTTLGDMTVVRATTATRVNSAGFIERVGVNVPRIDYTNGSCPSLLVEPQRTNLIKYSNDFTNAVWVSVSNTITANYAISPDGTQNATRLQSTKANSSEDSYLINVSQDLEGGCKSIYIKGVSSGGTMILGDSTIVFTTEWQRYSITSNYPFILVGARTGFNNIDVLIYGAQLEAGSYATSYIPTVAATVTRNADVISKTGISSLIGQTEGTLFVDLKNAYNGWINLSDNSDANGVLLSFSKEYSTLNYFIYANSVDIIGTGFVALPSEPMKLAFKYKSGEIKLFVNGVLAYTNTATFSFSNNLNFFGNRLYWGGGLFEGSINSEQLYKTALTDAECIALTTL